MASIFSSFLRDPRRVGAIVPSSKALALAMRDAAGGAKKVLELGAGTGPITAELVKLGIPVTSVELCPKLGHALAKKFPTVEVHSASAQTVLSQSNWVAQAVAVVSSLPFKSLPGAVSVGIIQALAEFLRNNPQAWVVQFTYHRNAPFDAPGGWQWTRHSKVWRNIPPANVWVLRKIEAIPH